MPEKLDLPLGKEVKYSYSYDKALLVGIPRKLESHCGCL